MNGWMNVSKVYVDVAAADDNAAVAAADNDDDADDDDAVVLWWWWCCCALFLWLIYICNYTKYYDNEYDDVNKIYNKN